MAVWTSVFAAESGLPVTNNPSAVTDTKASGAKWYKVSAQEFAAMPAAGEAIRVPTLDRTLLAAAIHHATNVERVKHGLPALQHDPDAAEAARLQADVMASEKLLGHENPSDAELRTPLDRIRKVGLRPGFIAENVALELARKQRSGEAFYTRTVDGVTVFSVTPDGPPIPMHTYRSFGEAVVQGWMNSPGHRANILSDAPRRLGCAGAPAVDPSGLEVFYCAQVFFAPAGNPKAN